MEYAEPYLDTTPVEPRKAWIVSSGEYSDYGVEAIFTTREKAQAYCDAAKEIVSDVAVEEFELDPEPPVVAALTTVYMRKDGHVVNDYSRTQNAHDEGFRFYSETDGGYVVWKVKTDDRKRAIKVVNEKRAQLIACDAWGDDEATRKMLGVA